MKMYEYLACGKPVVATAVPGVEMFSEIAVATTPAEFNAKVQTALAEDNPEKQAARRALVLTHSWQSRVKQMLDIIIG
jgi:glycosyltransferase involved in cell wall biosynthesis